MSPRTFLQRTFHLLNMRQKKSNEIKDYSIITLAMLIGSIGLTMFLLPNHIPTGGFAGIASIIFWGLQIPVSVTYLVLNAIILFIALRILGWRFCVKTIYAVVTFSFFVFCGQQLLHAQSLVYNQPFMAAILGGVLTGGSIGMGLSSNGSTGGSDVIAAMINKYYDVSMGKIILLCDIIIITSSYVVLHDFQQVLYGYVTLVVASICVDKVVDLSRSSVQFFIISERYEEIGEAVNNVVQRGCTALTGKGFYSKQEVNMLFVLAKRSESALIFKTIDQIDPNAFVSQSAVIGVYGLGFDKFKVRRKRIK